VCAIARDAPTRPFAHAATRRWTTQKKLGYDLLDCDHIYVPINISNAHWVLVHIDVKQKAIWYRDSFCSYDAGCARSHAQFMCDVARFSRGLEWNVDDWQCGKPADALIPKQTDGSSCGVFVLESARYLVRVRPWKRMHTMRACTRLPVR
jgi:sentrin-specific protease 1